MFPRPPSVDLQALRRHGRLVARCALACYLLALVLSLASSVARQGALQMVCSGSGSMMVLALDDDTAEPRSGLTHHCPLCASAALPLPPPVARIEPCTPLAYAMRPVPAAWIAWVTAPPLPSRGPPAVSA